MNFTTLKILFLTICFYSSFLSTSHAGDRITGKEIKTQAKAFFADKQLSLDLLVSDKRTFFACSEPLEFKPRQEHDWTTLLVSCSLEDWSTLVRSTHVAEGPVDSNKVSVSHPLWAVVLKKNVSMGEVVSEQHVKLEKSPQRRIHGSYNEFKDVIGRKAKTNLAIGTILKARHLERVFSVNKEDTVLVIAGNNSIMITTSAIALENGQIGDMIPVRNTNSDKVFKVIITGKKKVAPITNM